MCRNQAYAARGYSQPPSIENAGHHPFLKELEASEAGGSAAAKETAHTAAAQPSAAAKPSTVASKPSQPPVSTAKAAPAAAPQPAQLFDLLSLHDVSLQLAIKHYYLLCRTLCARHVWTHSICCMMFRIRECEFHGSDPIS